MNQHLSAAPPARNRTGRTAEYVRRATEHRGDAERLGRRSRLISNLRGLSFGTAGIAAVTALASDVALPAWIVAGAALCAFVVLAAHHSRVIAAEDLAWRHFRVNDDAARRSRDEFAELNEDGRQFVDGSHAFSGDLDVFGQRSLFQCLNVAHTSYGQTALAAALTSTEPHEEVVARQTAVRELAEQLELRQSLEALTLAHPNPPDEPPRRARGPLDLDQLIAWAESEPQLSPRTRLAWGARLLPAITLVTLLASQLTALPAFSWTLPLALQILLATSAAPVAGRVFAIVSSSPGAFSRLRPALELLESHDGNASLLKRLGAALRSGGRTASQQMTRFERVLSFFELRHNGMLYPFVNALLLWDVHCVIALEKWQSHSGKSIRLWLETLGQWESLSALAGFAHDNPDFQFPELSAGPVCFRAVGLGHPLIAPASRVGNDVTLDEHHTALLVTGSNMSGKSTLLRAMGLAAVLARAGTVVCAEKMSVSLLSVFSSMRISDSLSAGVSHFYAELEKLKAVLAAAGRAQPVLFLLDELLHGTNSEERQIGARWILSELIRAGAIGAVSTHDMALCRLPRELMNRVHTVHLRETVEGGRMSFDYRLREGPVRGGNALLLMRSIGLDVPLSESPPP